VSSASAIPPEKLELYERLVSTDPTVVRRGARMPYTSLNGNMFSFLTQEGSLALRLPAGEREAFLAKYQTGLVEQHGTVMKEYVAVPDDLLADTEELVEHFRRSVAYAGSLKPKAPNKR
jgi:hypothetical protein